MAKDYPQCIRCSSNDILETPQHYRCNDCGNKSLKIPSMEEMLTNSAETIYAGLGIKMTKEDKVHAKKLAKRIAEI